MYKILSGIKPTNRLHIGNFFGLIQTLQKLEEEFSSSEFFLFSADLHALTQGNIEKSSVLYIIKVFIALLNKKHNYYIQSDFCQITEISWFLTCFVSTGALQRMTQYKSLNDKLNINAGYLFYPVLMSADILAFDINKVPVGIDQKQHIELTRDIAQLFNHKIPNSFVLPEPIISSAVKIKDLQDASKKMSKSTANQLGTLFLDDDTETIIKKIKKATTDSEMMPSDVEEIIHTRAEVYNLCNIFKHITNQPFSHIEKEYGGKYISVFKKDLSDLMVDFIANIREKIKNIDNEEVLNILKNKKPYINNLLDEKLKKLKTNLFF